MYPISRNNSAASCSIRCNRWALPPSCSTPPSQRQLTGGSPQRFCSSGHWPCAVAQRTLGPDAFFARREPKAGLCRPHCVSALADQALLALERFDGLAFHIGAGRDTLQGCDLPFQNGPSRHPRTIRSASSLSSASMIMTNARSPTGSPPPYDHLVAFELHDVLELRDHDAFEHLDRLSRRCRKRPASAFLGTA
jgi:hypothetical protein